MVGRRLALAATVAALVILSAPFSQQLFTAVGTAWPEQLPAIAAAATAVPAVLGFLFAVSRIRTRRVPRYLSLLLSVGLGGGYIFISGLSYGESFHFVEYGLLSFLFYRAWRPLEDASVLVLPVLAGTLTGVLDEWFQWFIPIRAGEARDIGINTIALACGLLFSLSVNPPERDGLTFRHESLPRVGAWAAAVVVAFAWFFQSVHLGYDIRDAEAGSFRSRHTAPVLTTLNRERAMRWRDRPPIVQRRLAREDQYLAEGLWHVQRRNARWGEGDAFAAWHENRILEKFYEPVLDISYRWPPEQRADAEARAAGGSGSYVSDAQPVPIYTWPKPLYWAVHFALLSAIAMVCRRARHF